MQAKSGGMQQGAISMATKVIQLVVQRVYKRIFRRDFENPTWNLGLMTNSLLKEPEGILVLLEHHLCSSGVDCRMTGFG